MKSKLTEIAQHAGQLILNVYSKADVGEMKKADDSPLTQADLESHNFILEALEKNFDFPVLSEESKSIEYSERSLWETFWLVDPLDGTKDFLAKNDQFTVNIALIQKGRPVVGLIHIPAFGETFFAEKGKGAFFGSRVLKLGRPNEPVISTDSNFHSSEATQNFLQKNSISEVKPVGSSIKFCRIAQGEIDIYPRLAPTMEWDIAAGHIIATEAGAKIVDLATNEEPRYNKENLLNNHFVVFHPEVQWSLPET